MQTSIGVLLASILLGAVLALGSCAGVDTSQIEELADMYGINVSTQDEENVASTGNEGLGLFNPWTETADAVDAAEGAGLDSFLVAESDDLGLDLGGLFAVTYSYTDDGMAQALLDFPASQVLVRKAVYTGEDDISGDYRTFGLQWTETFGDVEVTCQGNRAGAACKTTWVDGDYAYAIVATGLGGDADFGLTAASLEGIVDALY